jgi:phosphomannomutase
MSEETEPLAELIERAHRWISHDPDPSTRAALGEVLRQAEASGDATKLVDLMGYRLEFGTAGLRGEMGPGSNRLNRLMARQTAAGLAAALLAHSPGSAERGVIVGHDARHHSEAFAHDVVDVLAAAGIETLLVDGPNPTPLMAWALRHRGAAAAVVVTASHNPAKDNGIKIYWGDGAQIVPPVDGWIASEIDKVAWTNPVAPPVVAALAPPALTADYVDMVASLVGGHHPERGDFVIAATAMHGVGGALLQRCLAATGFTNLHTVAAQQLPDPDFPTVAFPNPEEPGATDLLLALATEVEADIAVANDPDADRLAVGIRTPQGGFRMLSGDELGALFAIGLMERRAASSEELPTELPPTAQSRQPLLVTTVVSSQLLAAIAANTGAAFFETLTGFKWLCRPGFEHPELDQVLAYEESIGYAVGGLCDKDGLSAATVFCDLARGWRAQGRTPQMVLDELATAYGAHVTDNFSIRVKGPGWVERLVEITANFVAHPPESIEGIAVDHLDQPAEDVIRLFLANGDRVVIRPSGTEPKLKCYCEAVEPVAANSSAAEAHTIARQRAARLHAAIEALLAA